MVTLLPDVPTVLGGSLAAISAIATAGLSLLSSSVMRRRMA
jgi:hypothetical protein